MENGLAPGDGLVAGLAVAHVALDELDLFRDVGEVLAFSGGEVVQHDHVVPSVQNVSRQVASDETGPAGDQVFRHVCLSYRFRGFFKFDDLRQRLL